MKRGWLVALAILGFSFIAAYWSGLAARSLRQSAPPQEVIEGLVVTAADLDMGDVWEDKAVVRRLPIRNQTTAPITLRDFDTSCACTAVEPRSLSIPPGQTATIDLKLDLTHRSLSETGLGSRPFAVSIHPIVSSASQRNRGWQLHGTIKSRVTLDTPTVHFGEQPIHGQTPVAQKVVATVHVPCQRLDVVVNPDVATVTVERRDGDETRFDLVVAPNSTLPPGKFHTDAKINMVALTGERALAFVLPIAGEMRPEVRLFPARLLLETKPIGTVSEAVVTLQAPPDTNVAVDHIEIDDPGLRVEPAAVAGILAGRAYRIRQAVAKEGDQVSAARFVIRKPGQKLITLAMEVCYRGGARETIAATTPREKRP